MPSPATVAAPANPSPNTIAPQGPVELDQVPVSKCGLWGLVGFLAAVGFSFDVRLETHYRVLICAGGAAIPMILYDLLVLKVHLRKSAGLDRPVNQRGVNWARVGVKVVGLCGTLGAIAIAYLVFREYHGRFYYPFWNILKVVAVPAAVLTVPYIAFVDGRMSKPRDGYWHVGAVILGNWKEVDRNELAKHFRGWLVKGFFLPLMIVYLGKNLDTIAARAHRFNAFVGIYDFAWLGMYTVDVGFAVVGYSLTFRLLDAHMRSAEPTMLGWAVCIACYQPFWATIERMYLHYEDGLSWGRWLSETPIVHGIWGGAILACTFVYVWATVTFGLRFSNLTHRGVLTFGPYRLLRHPAYVSKNLSWWLISIPFIPMDGDWASVARNCIALLCLNGIYTMRAVTEERHLGRDPAYTDYQARTPLLFARIYRRLRGARG